MKKILYALTLMFSLSVYAHEGGHGEVAESGKFGGITAPVVSKTQAGMGDKAKVIFKSELVRSADGTLRIYLFDNKMNLLPLEAFSEKIDARLEVKKKGKFTYVGQFVLVKNGNHYVGKLPAIEYKPFNIDLFFSHQKQQIFAGFSNLD